MTLQQFREMKATFLLFMKNIRRIEVKVYHSSEKVSSSSTYSMQDYLAHNMVRLKERVTENGELQENIQYYHIRKLNVSDMPKSENRQYGEGELSSRAYAKTQIVLALPLTEDSIPIIQEQDLYAFLPVRNLGLSVLGASRLCHRCE
ncbi:hypothetical protein BDV06DRAFT_46771 [Aspergillus oleicola]